MSATCDGAAFTHWFPKGGSCIMELFVCGDPPKDDSANPARLSGSAEGDLSLEY